MPGASKQPIERLVEARERNDEHEKSDHDEAYKSHKDRKTCFLWLSKKVKKEAGGFSSAASSFRKLTSCPTVNRYCAHKCHGSQPQTALIALLAATAVI